MLHELHECINVEYNATITVYVNHCCQSNCSNGICHTLFV